MPKSKIQASYSISHQILNKCSYIDQNIKNIEFTMMNTKKAN